MPKFKIVHNQAVWERTVVEVEVSEEDAELLRPDSECYDPGYVDRVLNDAILSDEATVEVTGSIDSMDSDTEVEELE